MVRKSATRNAPGSGRQTALRKPASAGPSSTTGTASTPLIVANGISGITGRYAMPPQQLAQMAQVLKGQTGREAAPRHVIQRAERLKQRAFTRGLPFGVEPDDLGRAGWGIVFHENEAAAVRKEMQVLVDHRRRQVRDGSRVKELVYRTGETATDWLVRHDVSWGTVTPEKVPYYLLWVGSPRLLPFGITHEIDSDYLVGLLEFSTAEEYRRYAESLIDYETAAGVSTAKEVAYFGTRHPFDDATAMSADWLVQPLANGLGTDPPLATQLGFRQRLLVNDGATRQALIRELEGVQTRPSVLFTASHGMVWPSGDPRQVPAQGAILCQDFPGFGEIQPSHFLTAADVPATARVHGLIGFHFACYGGGTPKQDLYAFDLGQPQEAIAPDPFIAALPRRLLAHPGGGALACIAHVERAWPSSITGLASSPQIRAFQRALGTVLVGKPLGLAVQEFNDLSAKLSEVLTGLLEQVARKQSVNDFELVSTWTARNDAGGFVLIGDPAARLRVWDLI
jgi:hypothetical protein